MQIHAEPNPDPHWEYGSGSRRAKITHISEWAWDPDLDCGGPKWSLEIVIKVIYIDSACWENFLHTPLGNIFQMGNRRVHVFKSLSNANEMFSKELKVTRELNRDVELERPVNYKKIDENS